MVAMLIGRCIQYSRFIYMFTIGFGFSYSDSITPTYRKYWLSGRKAHSFARKMLLITTSDVAESVLSNIMKEKTWDLWVTASDHRYDMTDSQNPKYQWLHLHTAVCLSTQQDM